MMPLLPPLLLRRSLVPALLGILAIAAPFAGGARASDGGAVVALRDFGAVGDGHTNDLPAFRAALAKATSLPPPVVLQFDSGKVYRFDEEPEQPASVPVLFAQGLTIDGGGSTVLVHPANRLITFYRCRDVTLQNLTIDYSPLPFTQGAVVALEPQQNWIEFEVQKGYPLPHVGGAELYGDQNRSDVDGFRAATRMPIHEHSRLQRVEQVGERRYRCWLRDRRLPSRLSAGDWIVMKVLPPAREPLKRGTDSSVPLRERGDIISGSMASIYANQSHGVTLRAITSYAAPAMTVMMSGCDGVVIDRFVIRRKPGTDRLIAGESDGVHLKTNGRAPRIENCSFEGTMDDSIHVKTSGDIVREAPAEEGGRFKIRHMDVPPDDTNMETGRTVTLFRPQDRRVLGVATVAKYEPIDRREGWVTLASPVAGITQGTVLFLTSEGIVNIRHCDFGPQLQRAILVRARAHIEGCHFNDVPGIVVSAYPSGGIEGPLPEAFEFVDNIVYSRDPRPLLRVDAPTADYNQHGTYLVRGNTFHIHRDAAVVDFKHALEVDIMDNHITADGGDASAATRFRVSGGKSNRVENNRIEISDWPDAPAGFTRRQP